MFEDIDATSDESTAFLLAEKIKLQNAMIDAQKRMDFRLHHVKNPIKKEFLPPTKHFNCKCLVV